MKFAKIWSQITLTIVVMLFNTGLTGQALAQDQIERSISHVGGGLYVVKAVLVANYYTVFLVTDEGIIVADPINKDIAAWLKAELKERFNLPVKYLIYSHSDLDHATGGEVFADTAIFVGHRNSVTLFEKEGHGPVPTVLFDSGMEISLGGKKVELTYMGLSHTDNLIVMRFPEADAVFAPDLAYVKRLPWQTLPRYYYPGIIDALRALVDMDFTVAIPGHSEVGVKADFRDHLDYWEKLAAGVEKGRQAGLSLEEIKNTVRVDEYSHWGFYDRFIAQNVEGMYRLIENGYSE